MDRWRPVPNVPMQASAAVTRDRFVTQTGDQTCARTGVAGQRALGVAQLSIDAAEAALGKAVGVQVLGIAMVEASAAIARNDRVSSTNDGRAKVAVATEVPLGFALTAAAGAGELIAVFLTPGMPVV
jgi:Uncharacterized conserved protein (DUF2190)